MPASATAAERLVRFPPEVVETYRRQGLWGTRTIAQELRAVTSRNAARDAVLAPDGRLTYAELDERSDLVAAGLAGLGLAPGGRVLFQVGNSIETVLAWYGVLKAGLVPVCTLTQHRRREIDEIARQSEAVAHVVQGDMPRLDLVDFARGTASRIPSLRALVTVGAADPAEGAVRLADLGARHDPVAARRLVEEIQSRIDPDDPAVFQLSGGTTSVPKIIPRLHAEYWYNARAYAEFWGWGPEARVVHLLPLIHNAGIVCALHAAHAVGGCAVLAVPEPAVAAPLLRAAEPTDIMINLAVADIMLGDPPLRDALRGVQRLVYTGSRLPAHVAAAFEAPPTRIVQLFGMSEGLFTMTPPSASTAMRHHTVGVPMSPLDEIRICEPGTDREVADGEEGELCCRGPYTLRGYYGAPERNREAFSADGFYRTGDVARAHHIDGLRCYSIEGRYKDLINRGGEKVNAEEIELLILEHPDVVEAAVVAMPDERLVERACAYVVPASHETRLSLADVTAFLDGSGVAKFKWPERLELVDALPRTTIGKLDKKALREDIRQKLRTERAE